MAAGCVGAGRRTKEDEIDRAVGIVCLKKRGEEVSAGEALAEVHARDDASAAEAEAAVLEAYELATDPPREQRVVLDVIS